MSNMPALVDIINGCFEALGGIATWASAVRLYKDKHISGVDWRAIAFFTAWGLWNLFYYPVLDQWFSFFGGVVLVSGNVAWVWLALYYRRRYQEWP